MRLLANRHTSMHQGASSDLRRAREQLLHEPRESCDDGVGFAEELGVAEAGREGVERDVELRDRVVAGDVADGEDFEELADVVAVEHAGLLGVVELGEDVWGLAFGELGHECQW